jgi:hypothetical protein
MLGRYAIQSSVAPTGMSHSTSTPGAGVASVQEPPLTDVLALDSVASTASAVSEIPPWVRTSRMSAAIPRAAAIRFTLAGVVNGGL